MHFTGTKSSPQILPSKKWASVSEELVSFNWSSMGYTCILTYHLIKIRIFNIKQVTSISRNILIKLMRVENSVRFDRLITTRST